MQIYNYEKLELVVRILFAAPAKPTDNAPPTKGWEAIGGVNPPPAIKVKGIFSLESSASIRIFEGKLLMDGEISI